MPRTKSFDKVETLGKAREVFWQNDYHGIPPRDILEGAGVSRSGPWGLTKNLKPGLDKKAAADIIRITLSVL